MNVDDLVAELDPPLDVVEAELAQPPPRPWEQVMVLDVCVRGHPWAVYGRQQVNGGRECRRCRHLLDQGRTLAGDPDVVPTWPVTPAGSHRQRASR